MKRFSSEVELAFVAPQRCILCANRNVVGLSPLRDDVHCFHRGNENLYLPRDFRIDECLSVDPLRVEVVQKPIAEGRAFGRG